jgi:hypothetical protein
MRAFEIMDKKFFAADTLTGRKQETIEIWERETVKTIRVKSNPNADRASFEVSGRRPKLVIDDALAQTKVFIAKARSEDSEVDSILREVIGDRKHK